MSPTDQAATAGDYLTTNGEYYVDHRRGQVWGIAKAIVANDAASYSYGAPVQGASGPTANVNIDEIGGEAAALGYAPQAYGQDVAGDNAYTTVVTAGADRHHMSVSVETFPAIISIDSGTTDHYYIPAGTTWVFDNILIANAATIQGKNGTAGSNYVNLSISVW